MFQSREINPQNSRCICHSNPKQLVCIGSKVKAPTYFTSVENVNDPKVLTQFLHLPSVRCVLYHREIYKIIAVFVTPKTLINLILVSHRVLSCKFPSRMQLILKVTIQKVSFSARLAG